MNSQQFQSSVHAFCELYGATVEEVEAASEMLTIENGRIALAELSAPMARVTYGATPAEGPAQLEAGRRGLKLERRDGFDILRPA
jgi:hypothetical protein